MSSGLESYIQSGLPPLMIPTTTSDQNEERNRKRDEMNRQRRLRTTLEFATPAELCDRVAEVMTTDLYTVPLWAYRMTKHRAAAAQTENAPQRDIGTVNGFAFSDATGSSADAFHRIPPLASRIVNITASAVKLPTAEEFPVLTAAQRMEAARRLTVLLRRIEEECELIKEEERLAKIEEAVRDPYGAGKNGKGFVDPVEWETHLSNAVLQRLELRNSAFADYNDGPLLWTRDKMQQSAIRPRYQAFAVSEQQQRREKALRVARAGPLFAGMKMEITGLDPHNGGIAPPPPPPPTASGGK